MRTAADLTRRLARGGGRHDWHVQGLAFLALALSITVVGSTLGAIHGLSERSAAAGWMTPAAATGDGAAIQSLSVIHVAGQRVHVVRLAALPGTAELPAPPGLAAFPSPGQAAWSPGLRDLLAEHPDFVQPLGGVRATEVARAGLPGPDALVAVLGVGVDSLAGAPAWRNPQFPGTFAGPTRIDGFSGAPERHSDAAGYVALGWIGAVLLLVPVLTLGSAAVRLGNHRRSRRHAALRLAGAPARLLYGMLALEAVVLAAVGTLVAVVLTTALAPLLASVPVGGGRFFPSDLLLPATTWLGIAVASYVLLLVSAVVSVRRALADPLAVAQAHRGAAPGVWRVGAAAVVVAAFTQVTRSDAAVMGLVVLVFAAIFGVLTVIGPLAVSVLGAVLLRLSRRAGAPMLLAARRLLDDPRAAWRVVSGVVLASFVATVLVMLPVNSGGEGLRGDADTLEVAVPAGAAQSTAVRAQDELERAGLPGRVTVGSPGALGAVGSPDTDHVALLVPLPEGREADRVRAVLAHVLPGAPAVTGADTADQSEVLVSDFATAALIVLGTSLLVAAAATSITVAATTLDRRETYRRLWRAGVPVEILDRARMLESLVPLGVGSVLAVVAGAFAAAPLTLANGVSPSAPVIALAVVGAGLLAMWAAVRASRGLLLDLADL